jgi:hypothetical protein
MMLLLSRTGLRQNENAVAVGAQTGSRGLALVVRDLLGDETSPAAFVSEPIDYFLLSGGLGFAAR